MIQRVLWISQCVRSWDIWFFFLDKISLSTSCIVSANGLKFYRLIWNVFWLFYSILTICETIILTNSFIFTEERSSTGSSIMVRFQCFHWPQPLPYVCVYVVFYYRKYFCSAKWFNVVHLFSSKMYSFF